MSFLRTIVTPLSAITASSPTPTTTGAAFSKNDKLSPLEVYLNDIYTVGSSLAGLPSMSIPVGKDKNGLPLGLQVMGRKFDEETVYNMTKYVFENIEEIYAVKAEFNVITLEDALDGMPCEVHPGAMKYFKEQGIA